MRTLHATASKKKYELSVLAICCICEALLNGPVGVSASKQWFPDSRYGICVVVSVSLRIVPVQSPTPPFEVLNAICTTAREALRRACDGLATQATSISHDPDAPISLTRLANRSDGPATRCEMRGTLMVGTTASTGIAISTTCTSPSVIGVQKTSGLAMRPPKRAGPSVSDSSKLPATRTSATVLDPVNVRPTRRALAPGDCTRSFAMRTLPARSHCRLLAPPSMASVATSRPKPISRRLGPLEARSIASTRAWEGGESRSQVAGSSSSVVSRPRASAALLLPT